MVPETFSARRPDQGKRAGARTILTAGEILENSLFGSMLQAA